MTYTVTTIFGLQYISADVEELAAAERLAQQVSLGAYQTATLWEGNVELAKYNNGTRFPPLAINKIEKGEEKK